jgi:hypothetical protein
MKINDENAQYTQWVIDTNTHISSISNNSYVIMAKTSLHTTQLNTTPHHTSLLSCFCGLDIKTGAGVGWLCESCVRMSTFCPQGVVRRRHVRRGMWLCGNGARGWTKPLQRTRWGARTLDHRIKSPALYQTELTGFDTLVLYLKRTANFNHTPYTHRTPHTTQYTSHSIQNTVPQYSKHVCFIHCRKLLYSLITVTACPYCSCLVHDNLQ